MAGQLDPNNWLASWQVHHTNTEEMFIIIVMTQSLSPNRREWNEWCRYQPLKGLEPERRQHIVWEAENVFLATGTAQWAWKEGDLWWEARILKTLENLEGDVGQMPFGYYGPTTLEIPRHTAGMLQNACRPPQSRRDSLNWRETGS